MLYLLAQAGNTLRSAPGIADNTGVGAHSSIGPAPAASLPPGPGEGNVFDAVNTLFSRADALTEPRHLVNALQQMSVVWAVIFLIAGLICLLNGYKLYKWVVICLALTIGLFAGYAMGQRLHAEFVFAACLGALLAVACWPLMKYGIAVLGGLVGAFLGANLWGACAALVDESSRTQVANTHWVGALMGLIICGMLSFIVFKLAIVLLTSVSGAVITLIGALGLILQIPAWRESLSNWSQSPNASQIILPLLVVVPAIIGLVLQQTRKEEPVGGPGGGKPAAKTA